MVSFHRRVFLSGGFFPSDFPAKIVFAFLISHSRYVLRLGRNQACIFDVYRVHYDPPHYVFVSCYFLFLIS